MGERIPVVINGNNRISVVFRLFVFIETYAYMLYDEFMFISSQESIAVELLYICLQLLHQFDYSLSNQFLNYLIHS